LDRPLAICRPQGDAPFCTKPFLDCATVCSAQPRISGAKKQKLGGH
jgi:hypothetical protein